jgi:beta-aspartyl-dipeptidase (metallo-type)
MLTLLRNAHVFAPDDIGVNDILIGGGKILQVGPNLPAVPAGLADAEEIDLRGWRLVPGFIDTHVHLSGGGGNDGYASRIPDLQISDLTLGGITTAVSCLGVDPYGKSLESMLMKARGLAEEGITTYIYAGSFLFGRPTFTGDLREDMVLIPEMLGIKIAIAEARGTHPTERDLARLASDAYGGGLLSGRPGCLNIHLGLKAENPYPLLAAGLDLSGVPADRFIVTHVNYSDALLKGALEFVDYGTYLNVDSILTPTRGVTAAVEPHLAIVALLEAGVPIERIGMSTDGNASVPRRRPDGERGPYRLGFDTFAAEVRSLIDRGVDWPTALAVVTTTPARMLGLQGSKGRVAVGLDADLIVTDERLRIRDVYALGAPMVRNGRPVVLGMYENEEQLPEPEF